MNDGVAMLIDRMKTNPEEFIAEAQYGTSKWSNILSEHRLYLDKEDLEAFDAAHKATVFEYMQQRFTEKVMEELVDPKKLTRQDVINQYQTKGMPLGNWAAGSSSTITANALTIGKTTLTEEKIKQILKSQSTPIAGVTQTV